MGIYTRHIMPRLLEKSLDVPAVTQLRQDALVAARGQVLEIGFGTGLNLPCYGADVTRLSTVEPNPGMNRLAQKRLPATLFQSSITGCTEKSYPLPLPAMIR